MVTKKEAPQEVRVINLTASYAHKLVPENHGIEGHRFAPLDFFQSYNDSIDSSAPEEEIRALSAKLHRWAKEDVESRIAETIREMKKQLGIITDPTGEEYKQIAEYIVAIESATSEDAVKEVGENIKKEKDKLTETQLEYLRHITRKANARFLKKDK